MEIMDHDAAVSHVYRQLAPRTPDGGRRIVFSCPYCGRPWLMNGRGFASFTLLPEAPSVHAGALPQATLPLSVLPEAICESCSRALGGQYLVEEYFSHDGQVSTSCGYRFQWEGAGNYPSFARLCCTIFRMDGEEDWRRTEPFLDTELDVVLSSPTSVGAVLAWLKGMRVPAAPWPYRTRACENVSAPASAARGCAAALEWKGYTWMDWCPPLECDVAIGLAVALPEDKPCCPPDVLWHLWSGVLPAPSGQTLCHIFRLPHSRFVPLA